eukprot:CAMPEP_0181475210 /NCGR_PEP_ID=MMETSP1110-20121109/41066_1 /TAXON_ID=174948 /ORGANISM="Symbiodinium sp., Strain CCMP421" /LENGTH=86 /DNA_ID=CAMNT_0023600439 /DNA_START=27 /DNA_END=284 /DNA_ORIENTATION=+
MSMQMKFFSWSTDGMTLEWGMLVQAAPSEDPLGSCPGRSGPHVAAALHNGQTRARGWHATPADSLQAVQLQSLGGDVLGALASRRG